MAVVVNLRSGKKTFSNEDYFPTQTDDSNPEALRELRYSFGARPELPTSAPILRKGSC